MYELPTFVMLPTLFTLWVLTIVATVGAWKGNTWRETYTKLRHENSQAVNIAVLKKTANYYALTATSLTVCLISTVGFIAETGVDWFIVSIMTLLLVASATACSLCIVESRRLKAGRPSILGDFLE